MKVVTEPEIYIVGRQQLDTDQVGEFLDAHNMYWLTPTLSTAELLVEASGRVCYMSFGRGRTNNEEYIANLIGMRHGSVLEHAVWNFIIAGVSRSFTHELVRHRIGWSYSQLSQRYVDEADCRFIMPPAIRGNTEAEATWACAIENAHRSYIQLVDALAEQETEGTKTERRKRVRQAARSVLPNATETIIFCTANARALRHFFEMRAAAPADAEMRQVAMRLLELMKEEAPNIFGDYHIIEDGGVQVAHTENIKV